MPLMKDGVNPLLCPHRTADDRNLPALPGVLGLPALPEINGRSFASQNMQPVLDALPTFAPTPSVDQTVTEAGNTVAAGIKTAQDAVAPGVQSLSAALGPISQIRSAVDAAIAPAVRPLLCWTCPVPHKSGRQSMQYHWAPLHEQNCIAYLSGHAFLHNMTAREA